MATRKQNKSLYAVLGILAQRDASGYEIQKLIASSIGYFWSESFGQIYPVLKELAGKGLIKSVSADVGKKTRSRHRITPQGRKALAAWLAEPPAPEVIRNEMLLKVFFGAEAAPDIIVAHLTEQYKRNQHLLAQFQGIEAAIPASNEAAHFWRLTLDYGRRGVEAELAWLTQAITAIGQWKPRKKS